MRISPRWPLATWQAAVLSLLVIAVPLAVQAALGRPITAGVIVLVTGFWPATIYLYHELVTRERQVTVGIAATALGIGTLLPVVAAGLLLLVEMAGAL